MYGFSDNEVGARNLERGFSLTKMPAKFELENQKNNKKIKPGTSFLSHFSFTETSLATSTTPTH